MTNAKPDGKYCVFCGAPVKKKNDACHKCGKPYGPEKFSGVSAAGSGGVGWSEHAGDPVFKRNRQKTVIATLIFLIVVSLIIFIFMLASGDASFKSGGLTAFACAMGVLWVFWIIWFIIKSRPGKEWEGTVEHREKLSREYSKKDGDGNRYKEIRTVYTVYFRTDQGRKKKDTRQENSVWYDYLQEGDRVKYHGKLLNYFEKYDKSADTVLPCASCGSLRDVRENYCGRCGAVMLKSGSGTSGSTSPAPAYEAFAPADPAPEPVQQSPAPAQEPQYPSAQSPAPAADTPAPAGEKVCPVCGTVSSGGAFCEECGAKL